MRHALCFVEIDETWSATDDLAGPLKDDSILHADQLSMLAVNGPRVEILNLHLSRAALYG